VTGEPRLLTDLAVLKEEELRLLAFAAPEAGERRVRTGLAR
jgi:hypothetical protein